MNRPDPGDALLLHRAPPDLLARGLQRAAAPPPLRAPRRARAAGIAAAALAAGFLLGLWAGRSDHPDTVEPAGTATSLVPAALDGSPVPVRFVLHAPTAATVGVAGSWNGWDPTRAPLRNTGGGLFVGDLPLERGRHAYMFVVDGSEWLADPAAAMHLDDGFGHQNAILEL